MCGQSKPWSPGAENENVTRDLTLPMEPTREAALVRSRTVYHFAEPELFVRTAAGTDGIWHRASSVSGAKYAWSEIAGDAELLFEGVAPSKPEGPTLPGAVVRATTHDRNGDPTRAVLSLVDDDGTGWRGIGTGWRSWDTLKDVEILFPGVAE